jgi:hypothetical protein
MIAFRIDASAPRAAGGGRTVTVRFLARAPGVSPVNVALRDADDEPAFEGKGIVRVR